VVPAVAFNNGCPPPEGLGGVEGTASRSLWTHPSAGVTWNPAWRPARREGQLITGGVPPPPIRGTHAPESGHLLPSSFPGGLSHDAAWDRLAVGPPVRELWTDPRRLGRAGARRGDDGLARSE
jgi:hypothetical protein